ncbi:outer membrane protein assembly factor BamB family protein [Streptomyces sp. NPDC001606]
MAARHRAAVGAAMVLAVGLLAGCRGGGTEGAGESAHATPGASASAARRTGPDYAGPALPGLTAAPVWSLGRKDATGCAGDPAAHATGDPRTCVVGDAVVVTQDLTGKSGRRGAEPAVHRFRARLYAAATGRLRRTIDITVPAGWTSDRPLRPSAFVQVTSAKDGSPALLVTDGDVTPADGAGKASLRTTYTLYAPSGTVLGRSSFDGAEFTDLTAEAGHLLLRQGTGTSTYVPIGGGAPVRVHNLGDGDQPVGAGFGVYAFSTYDAVDGSGSRLAVGDRRTGAQLWTLAGIRRPTALAGAKAAGLTARLLPLTGDEGLLVWDLPPGSAHDVQLTVVDLGTGRMLAEGPRMDEVDTARPRTVLSPDGRTAVTRLGAGAVAWDVRSGRELWRQRDGEQGVTPEGLPTARVLYAAAGDQGLTALDLATRKVLAENLAPDAASPEDSLAGNGAPLEFTTDGHAVLAGRDLFVFAPQKGSRG